jgi:nicotinate-nucleotide adenylyltransferase
MRKTGLFFGSFNPIHVGHLIIANYMVEYTDLDQLWFVVSPHNPLKKKSSLLEDYHRYEMVYRVLKSDERFEVSDIEFRLPKPSYTIDTLTYLEEKRRGHEYSLIMGSDGLRTFNKWKNADIIVQNYRRLVYPRPGTPKEIYEDQKNISVVEAPQMDISSTFLRQAIKENKDIRYFMPKEAYDYILEMNFYT